MKKKSNQQPISQYAKRENQNSQKMASIASVSPEKARQCLVPVLWRVALDDTKLVKKKEMSNHFEQLNSMQSG
jgi:hypothetical protein